MSETSDKCGEEAILAMRPMFAAIDALEKVVGDTLQQAMHDTTRNIRRLAARDQWEACYAAVVNAAWPAGGANRAEVIDMLLEVRLPVCKACGEGFYIELGNGPECSLCDSVAVNRQVTATSGEEQ